MFAQELLLAHETTEDGKNDDSVVNAIQLEWIGQAPLDTSRANIRRRRLPAQQTVWLVVWMGLQRNKVCSSLDLTLPLEPSDTWSRVAPSVLTDSRRCSSGRFV